VEYKNVTGRIYDIQGYAVHDGPGIRTTVFTKGCPLKCLWCHSPESQHHELELGYLPIKCLGTELCQNACVNACPEGALFSDEPVMKLDKSGMIKKVVIDREKCTGCLKCADVCITKSLYASAWDTTVDEVYDRVMKDSGFFNKNNGGITISGGEAMAQFDFTLNLAKRLKDSGIHICLDTTGFARQEMYAEIMPYIDLFLYDIKHMDSEMHKRLTSVPNELIISNAMFLSKNNAAMQVRVPVIPKLSDKEGNLRQTAELCMSLGGAVKLVQLLPYHKTGRMKYERLGWKYKLTNVEPPEDEFMQKTLEMFKGYGLNVQLY